MHLILPATTVLGSSLFKHSKP